MNCLDRKWLLYKIGAPRNCVIIWKKFKILHAESNIPGLICVTATFMAQYHRQTYLSVDKKNQLNVTLFVFFISLLIVAQHVSGNHVPIIRSWRLREVIASCWYVLWLQGGCQVRLVGSASMDELVSRTHPRTHLWLRWQNQPKWNITTVCLNKTEA